MKIDVELQGFQFVLVSLLSDAQVAGSTVRSSKRAQSGMPIAPNIDHRVEVLAVRTVVTQGTCTNLGGNSSARGDVLARGAEQDQWRCPSAEDAGHRSGAPRAEW
mmetsp:Transcript_10360/g.27576  ORF Transcript_10360/g.27576 Transcript_10360/m.27576 type:complete len:105 (-) Transcript_10360:611-925(-)